ncbi:hypothetical protein [Brevundimonas lutea]|nr:hypothetical protein [Brevundimonas lutea]
MMRAIRTGLFIGLIIGLSACGTAPGGQQVERGPYAAGDFGG